MVPDDWKLAYRRARKLKKEGRKTNLIPSKIKEVTTRFDHQAFLCTMSTGNDYLNRRISCRKAGHVLRVKAYHSSIRGSNRYRIYTMREVPVIDINRKIEWRGSDTYDGIRTETFGT